MIALKNVMTYSYNIGDSAGFKELNIGNFISLGVRVVYKCTRSVSNCNVKIIAKDSCQWDATQIFIILFFYLSKTKSINLLPIVLKITYLFDDISKKIFELICFEDVYVLKTTIVTCNENLLQKYALLIFEILV